ncbi:MAG: hypothetical protein PF545_01130 [Elusimicrobia bacterium]|jgi:hypothetical protein|nr:hypothetical protein [Elusimicrobiota bacterium]
MRKIFFTICLLAIIAPVKGEELSLIDDEALEVFELKKSSGVLPSEELLKFIRERDLLEFDSESFKEIIRRKESGDYVEPEQATYDMDKSTASADIPQELPQAEVELPYQTRMSITGQKSISVKYGNVFYSGSEEERTVSGVPGGTTKGFEMDQELKVRIKGKVGEKITVNVDYDDTQPAYNEEARKISVLYKGDPDEIIQEAAFGDVNLSIPSTKFVGYSKKVFGVSIKGSYDKLDFMAIGSQTKGRTDVKEFTGKTTFTKKDIKDINYMRRKYYSIDLDTAVSRIPIEAASLKIYVDDKDVSNIVENNESTMTVTYFNSTATYKGYFYQLVAGRDFTFDNKDGVITFEHSIQEDYVIAVEYKYDGGNKEVGYLSGKPAILKDEKETLNYEIKNIYNLGASRIIRDDFVIKFLNLNREEVSIPDGTYRIDYDQGILEFTEQTPFYDSSRSGGYNNGGYQDIYDNTDPKNHYVIYVEYKKKVRNYYLRPNILRDSERVILDGHILIRGSDYVLDYPSGFLTFLNPEDIDETTAIEVTYDYMPFGGLFNETLVGLRAKYNFTNNLFLGGTMLYNWSSAGAEIPDVTSTPQSNMVLDTDFSFKIPKSRFFPLPTSISGEAARSIYNPNTLGKAMIDNMEGVKQERAVSSDADSWQVAATPTGQDSGPSWVSLSDEDIYISEINKKVESVNDEKLKVLYMEYSLPSSSETEASIVNVISRRGVDLSDKNNIELWVKGDGRGTLMQLDFGNIDEDADNTGEIKTEDRNNNGTLDLGEDAGWKYLYNGSTYTIGADNGRIDTNDLDGDGFLDPKGTLNSSDEALLAVNWTGWKRIIIPRGGDDADWEAVKHVRVTLKGKGSGEIAIASFEIVGNKWQVGKGSVTVKAVNNYDNDDYITPLDMSIYEDIYNSVGGSGLEKEQALEINYDPLPAGATGYVYTKLATAVDYSKHKKINLLIYGDGSGVDYLLEFGAGNNLFIKKIRSNFIGWKKFTYKIPDDFTESGNPSLTNIKEVRLGVVNNTSGSKTGKVWFNEVYLSNPGKRTGTALSGKVNSSIPGLLDFGGSYRSVDRNFQTITTPPKNQDNITYSVDANLKAVPFMPVSGSYTESEVVTPAERIKPGEFNPYLSADDAGKVTKKTSKLNSSLNIKHLPDIKGSYSRTETKSNFTGKNEDGLNYRGDISYTLPFTLLVLPKNIRGYYRNTDNYITYKDYKRAENPAGGFENYFENTIEYSGTADINFLKVLTLKPSYKKNEKDKEWEFYSGPFKETKKRWPWSRSQGTDLNTRLNILSWFSPQAGYSVNIAENYNYTKSPGNFSLRAGNKDISRNFSLNTNASLPVKKILPFIRPLDTLNLTGNMNFDRGETYQNIENDFYVFDKLDQRYELSPATPTARLVSLSRKNSKTYKADWQPMEFLNINKGFYNMFGGMRTRTTYNRNETIKEKTGTVLKNVTQTWPDISIDYGSIDKLYLSRNFLKDIRLKNNYRFKEAFSYSNGVGTIRDININYGADCRVNIFKDYDSLFQYSKGWQKKFDLQQGHWTTYSENTDYSGQIKFVLKKYWNLIARYSQKNIRKEAYNSEDPLTDSRVYTPSLQFNANIDMPTDIKIPFSDKKIKLANKLRVNGELKADFSRSVLNIDKDNTDKYLFNASAGMDVSSNIRFTMGTGGQYLYNRVKEENSYFAFHFNSDMVIRF